MENKAEYKTVENDPEEILENIRRHRQKIIRRVIAAVLIIGVVVVGIQLWEALRTYSGFEIRNQTERQNAVAAKYENFQGKILEYNNDGIICYGSDNKLIWNQSFEMMTPTLDMCGNYMTIYDQGGTCIYIMTGQNVVKKIETSTPIRRVCIGGQGTIAVLMKADSVSYVRIYDRKGKELANGEFYEEKGCFPVDIALSKNAQKLAIDMLDITSGKTRSTVSFYNFGSVGQNEIDNHVGTYDYDDMLISEIKYVSTDRMIAVGDTGIVIFGGAQKPSPVKTIKFEKEIQSVFHNDKYVGVVYSNSSKSNRWHIRVYDMRGKSVMENDIDQSYECIEFLRNNEICVRSRHQCDLYTIHSIHKFSYTFDEELYKVLSGEDRQEYTFIMNGEMEDVRLR